MRILFLLILYSFFFIFPMEKTENGIPDQEAKDVKSMLIIVLHPIDITCQICSVSFFALCDSLTRRGLNDQVIGIFEMLSNTGDKFLKDHTKAFKKQLRGFIAANRIQFPVLADDRQIFLHSSVKGSRVILMNTVYGIVQEWPLPVEGHQISEIMALLK